MALNCYLQFSGFTRLLKMPGDTPQPTLAIPVSTNDITSLEHFNAGIGEPFYIMLFRYKGKTNQLGDVLHLYEFMAIESHNNTR